MKTARPRRRDDLCVEIAPINLATNLLLDCGIAGRRMIKKEQIRGQMEAVNLPLYAVTLTAVPHPDTPVLLMLHWHGFRHEVIVNASEARPVAFRAIPASALQLNARWRAVETIDLAAMEAAWELGAWDVARSQRRSCMRPGADTSEALECLRAFGNFPEAMGSDLRYPKHPIQTNCWLREHWLPHPATVLCERHLGRGERRHTLNPTARASTPSVAQRRREATSKQRPFIGSGQSESIAPQLTQCRLALQRYAGQYGQGQRPHRVRCSAPAGCAQPSEIVKTTPKSSTVAI
jgi:hypothetical protein